MTVLVVTEKYSQAVSFAKVLGAKEKNTRFDRGNIGYYRRPADSNAKDIGEIPGKAEVIVSWCAGHLLGPAMPGDMDEKMQHWSLDTLPFFPKKWKFEHQKHEPAKSQWVEVKKWLDDNAVDTIYIATDSDREGCLIYHLLHVNSSAWKRKPKMMRCWYIEFTEAAVKKALEDAKPQSEYDDLVSAAVSRMKFDYCYGINMSRAYTVRHHSTRNVGRVISSTLYLLSMRQKEIDNFVPQDYITIKLPLKDGDRSFSAEKKMEDIAAGQELASKLKGSTATIKKITKKTERESRKLFNTTKLQVAAGKRNITAKQSSDALQALWDLGAISYPRTSAEHLLEMHKEELKDLPDKIYEKIFASPSTCSPSDFDLSRAIGKGGKSAEEASHTGLYPTMQGISLYHEKIKKDPVMRMIFLLIASRFLCAIMPQKVSDKTSVVVEACNTDFNASGSVIVDPGFSEFEKYINKALATKKTNRKATATLPELAEGEQFSCMAPKTSTKKTKPPKQYDEPGLLAAMESASQFVDDKKMKDMLKNAGIGTSASRSGIIATIRNGGYVDIKGGRFYPTEKTETLLASIPEKLKTPVMTAQMELKLDEIARGELDSSVFLSDIEKMVEEEIARIKELPPIPDTERYKDNKVFMKEACPRCGANIAETQRSMVCQSNCGFVVWRSVAKKKLSKQVIKYLIEHGHTEEKIEGLKSKAGKDFSCWLYIDENWKVSFDFSDDGVKAKKQNAIALGTRQKQEQNGQSQPQS